MKTSSSVCEGATMTKKRTLRPSTALKDVATDSLWAGVTHSPQRQEHYHHEKPQCANQARASSSPAKVTGRVREAER